MAKKTRKQKQRAVTRRPSPSFRPLTSGAPGAAAATGTRPAGVSDGGDAEPVDAPQPGGDAAASVAVNVPAPDAGRRRVERVGVSAPTTRPRSTRGQTQGYIQALESEDAAIPFDRVPYVPSDLRRVAIIAAVMVALIIVADIIVSNVVK
ncbi:MAG TPA: hypothetical protein VH498_03945 [Candidatus Dormibacteraeota bacterium]|jgi:hypothetical protein|nr:hypothetical protein [Candidatus Dormibacteraeota bacterium]